MINISNDGERNENFGNDKFNPSDTLVSKIMMGVYGCVPAYDGFFKEALGKRSISPKIFNENGLKALKKYYDEFENDFDIEIKLINNMELKYTKAKILDQVFWFESFLYSLAKKSLKNGINKNNYTQFLRDNYVIINKGNKLVKEEKKIVGIFKKIVKIEKERISNESKKKNLDKKR